MIKQQENRKQNPTVRLIASDLDGTLLTPDKQITPFTSEILTEASRRGIHFVPCTGRPFDAVPEFVRGLPGVEYVITSNGAAVYSVASGHRIYERLLDEETVEKILELPLSQEIATEVLVEGVPYTESRYVEDPARFGATEYGIQYIKETRKGLDDIRSFLREHRAQADGINFMLKSLGEFTDADRAYVFETSENHTSTNTYEWCAAGVTPQIRNLHDIPFESMPKWIEVFLHGENILIEDLEAYRESMPLEYELLKVQNVSTLIAFPISVLSEFCRA